MGTGKVGLPQVRAYGWLYEPDHGDIPTAHVRLEAHVDGSGWDLHLNDPASARTKYARYAEEADARTALARVYADRAARGTWRRWEWEQEAERLHEVTSPLPAVRGRPRASGDQRPQTLDRGVRLHDGDPEPM